MTVTNVQQECIVMGAAIGYSKKQLIPFLTSLRKTDYEGAILLLVAPSVAASARSDPDFKGVTLLPVQQWLPVRFRFARSAFAMRAIWSWQCFALWAAARSLGALSPRGENRFTSLRMALACRLFPPSETRYLHYLEYLKHTRFKRILISDVRDVVFQKNPFQDLPKSGFFASMELPGYTVASEKYNSGWVRAVFGEKTLAEMGDNQVSCSGVSYGSRDIMLDYLQKMVSHIVGMNYKATLAAVGGYDQGIHNVLLRTAKIPQWQEMQSMESPVATINGVEETKLRFNEAGHLLNINGEVIAIVHQYDRCPELHKKLFASLALSGATATTIDG